MSGGSLDYVYGKVEDAAVEIRSRAKSSLHLAFADHLTLVSKALRDIEWMFSCDTSPGDEEEAIQACLALGAELSVTVREAIRVRDELSSLIDRGAKA